MSRCEEKDAGGGSESEVEDEIMLNNDTRRHLGESVRTGSRQKGFIETARMLSLIDVESQSYLQLMEG